MATVGYVRVSTDKQTTDNQKLSILNYVNHHLKGGVDDWITVKASTRRSAHKRSSQRDDQFQVGRQGERDSGLPIERL